MSAEFCSYFAIAATAWVIGLYIVGPGRTIDLSRCVGWYFLVFALTYLLRPVGTEILGDTLLYDWLKIGTIKDHWQVMAFAVSLAIICFSIGYRISINRAGAEPADVPHEGIHIVGAEAVRKVMWGLLIWGYALFVFGFGTGSIESEGAGIAGARDIGVYTHNTAWLVQSDLFVSTGTTLYYLITGDLRMSLLIAAPWLMERLLYGWGRNFIIGHFFALMAVYFLRARFKRSSGPKHKQFALIGLAVVVIVALFPILGTLRALKSDLHISATSFSKDALVMVGQGVSGEDMVESYFGTSSDICGFEQSIYHLVTDRRPEWGTQYLYMFFIQPIPRIIWPGKGISFDWPLWLLGIDWNPRVTSIGMAAGAIGMAFEQWGWIGIPAEYLFTGWFFGWIEEKTRRRPNAAHLQLAYAGFYSSLPQVGRCTLLTLIAERWLFSYGIPVFILWRVYEYKVRSVQVPQRTETASIGHESLPAIPTG